MGGRRDFLSLTTSVRTELIPRATRWAWSHLPSRIQVANVVPNLIWRVGIAGRVRLKRYLPLFVRDFVFKYILPRSSFVVGNRRYIREPLDRNSFVSELEHRGIRYVLLRWFEAFPQWPIGEDMDILIHPADVPKTNDLFQLLPNDMPVDLFSADGSRNLSYGDVPYFPQVFADGLLQRSTVSTSGCRVPCAEDHFLSLAYHAVYHKCEDSGLPSRDGYFLQIEGEHDYGEVLGRLAENIGVKTDFTIEDLHKLMIARGIAPGLDMLRKLAIKKPNLLCLLPAEVCDRRGGELVAIVVRDWAIERAFLADFRDEIEKELKFEILEEIPIDSAARTRSLAEIRGGNWGAGPNPQSGGGPAVLLMCFDYHPIPPSSKTGLLHPFVKNENVIHAKTHLRNFSHARTYFREHANPVHTADDEVEALYYAEIVSPAAASRVRARLNDLRNAYATQYPVRELLPGFRRRAKVELIEYGGRIAVKKTFRLSTREYFLREVELIQSLQGQCPWLPEILAVGESFFVMPYYTNVFAAIPKKERTKILKRRGAEIIDIMRYFYDHGYALMDFHPRNLILDPLGRLILVDFEYVHRYRNKPTSFLDSFDVAGVPSMENGTLADGVLEPSMTYSIAWQPVLGPISRYVPV
jgi:hypothetical protein